MERLVNYVKALKELEEYFGIEDLHLYTLIINTGFFNVFEDSIRFADTEKDLEDENGKCYHEDYRAIIVKEDLTLVFIDNDWGGDDYYIIFKNENKIEKTNN